MLVSRVSTDERPSANRKGAGNPGGSACPSGDSSVINTSFRLFKTPHKRPDKAGLLAHVGVRRRGAKFTKRCLLGYKRQRSGDGGINYCNHTRH